MNASHHESASLNPDHQGSTNRTDGTWSSEGAPLDSATKEFMESRFAHDFSGVRIHTDHKAAMSAALIDASSYTVGDDIVFGQGQYQPESARGRLLLAHELAHVVQKHRRQDPPTIVRRQGPGVGGIHKSTVEIGPIVVGRTPEQAQARRRIADAALARYTIVGRQFIDEASQWALAGAQLAIDRIHDPTVRDNFDIALAGNLLWASTSIFAMWNPAVIPMSLVGATVGSGALSIGSPIPQARQILLTRMAKEADKQENGVRPQLISAAEKAADTDVAVGGDQDRILWGIMFPKIPWATRREEIVKIASGRVGHAMNKFIDDWNRWRNQVGLCIAGRMPPAGAGSPLLLDWARNECNKENPFKPTLDFNLPAGPR